MTLKDFQTAWLVAASQALETRTSSPDLSNRQLVSAAGLRLRTGLVAGDGTLSTETDDTETIGIYISPAIDPTDECPQ